MKTKTPQLDWREGRRRRAWELQEQGWKQQEIAAALGVTAGAVSQWLKRAREAGVEALRRHPAPGPQPKLSAEQRAQMPALLTHGAEAYGFRGQVWTGQRVTEVLRRTFGVTSHPAHVNRRLHALQHRVQRPVTRATHRDAAAMAAWWQDRWPAVEKKRSPTGGRSSGETSPASTSCRGPCAPGRRAGGRRCGGRPRPPPPRRPPRGGRRPRRGPLRRPDPPPPPPPSSRPPPPYPARRPGTRSGRGRV